jgi:hypothetical protein
MARMVVAGIQFISRPGYPNKMFSSVPQASEWLAGMLGDVSSSGLATTAEQLRRLLAPAGPDRHP